jgi:hypothetical protein
MLKRKLSNNKDDHVRDYESDNAPLSTTTNNFTCIFSSI